MVAGPRRRLHTTFLGHMGGNTMRARLLALFVLVGVSCASVASDFGSKPHIVFLFVDNVGWANLGFNRAIPTPEVVTPNLDDLAATGVHLDRHCPS